MNCWQVYRNGDEVYIGTFQLSPEAAAERHGKTFAGPAGTYRWATAYA